MLFLIKIIVAFHFQFANFLNICQTYKNFVTTTYIVSNDELIFICCLLIFKKKKIINFA